MTIKNRVKSLFRLPKIKYNMITYKGFRRPYRRNIYGKLYLGTEVGYTFRSNAEGIARRKFKDYIIAPTHTGPKKKKYWRIYVEADELIAFHKRRKS